MRLCGAGVTFAQQFFMGTLRGPGNADVEMDKATLNRIQEVSKLNEKEKDYIFVTLDALIRDFKTKHSFGIAQ